MTDSEWHKCYLCDCEFRDPSIPGYWGYCPSCRKVEEDHKADSTKPGEAEASPAKKSN